MPPSPWFAPTMRARTGTITRTEDGRWRVRATSPQGRRVSLGAYATEAEARRALVVRLTVLEEQSPGMSVADWTARHLDARELARELRDIDGQRSLHRAYLASDHIGDIQVGSLRRADVVAWLRRLSTRGLSRSTRHNALTLLRGALAAALEEGHARDNAASGLRLPRETRTEDTWRYLDVEAQGRLIAAAGDLGPMVAFAIHTGLRAGELCALRLADVDDERAVIRYGGPPDRPTKGGRVRVIELTPASLEAVRMQRDALVGRPNPHGLLWPATMGGYRQPKHVMAWHHWRALVERAGVDPALRWHDLRHTCASSLALGWWGSAWSQTAIQRYLGHASASVTERYMHLDRLDLRRSAAATHYVPAIGPAIGPVQDAPNTRNAVIYGELTRVIEPLTAGLQIPRSPESSRDVRPAADQYRSASRRLLLCMARGDEDGAEDAAAEMRHAHGRMTRLELLAMADMAMGDGDGGVRLARGAR